MNSFHDSIQSIQVIQSRNLKCDHAVWRIVFPIETIKLWPILVTNLETSEPGAADASDSAPATATMPMTVHPTATMPVFKSIAPVELVGFRHGKTAMCGDALSKKYQNSLNSLNSHSLNSHQSGDLIPADGVSRPFESAFSVNGIIGSPVTPGMAGACYRNGF